MQAELIIVVVMVAYSAGAAINSTRCSSNEFFSECASLCPETCDESGPRFCPEICLSACICREGFIREKSGGRCIARASCALHKCAGEHQVYSDCSTACPATCQRKPPRICIEICKRGCVCDSDHILDEHSGNCVIRSDCPGARTVT